MNIRSALPLLFLMAAPFLQGARCGDWGTCNTALPGDKTPNASFPNHVYDTDTEHFVIFLDPTSPDYLSIDPDRYLIMQEQLECAYRYFVCERKQEFPHTAKIPVYVGDHARAIYGQDYIELGEWILTNTPGREAKVYTQPVHEFFHRLAFDSGAYNGRLDLTEGLASLAEQMVSYETFTQSLSDDLGGRTTMLTQPQNDFSHGKSIFLRYFLEQLAGDELGRTVDEDWAVDELLGPLLDWMRTLYNEDPDVILQSLVKSHAVPGVSLSTEYDQIVNDFVTMRYAFDKVESRRTCRDGRDLYRQVKYSFRNSSELEEEATLALYSSGTVLRVGDTLEASNHNVDYGGFTPILGFRTFLGAEYHAFTVGSRVSNLLLTRGKTEDNVRFQVIFQRQDGCVIPHEVLAGGTFTEVVPIPTGSPIEEIVLVAYTVNATLTDGLGRLFGVTVEARP